MAEEETGLQTEENTEVTDSQTETGTPGKTEVEDTVNWEKRYKDAQAELTRSQQRLADIDARSETPGTQQGEETYEDDESFVDRKAVSKMIEKAVSKAVSGVRMQTADSYFRRTYPNIVKHENVISGILRNPKDPGSLKGASGEERIDAAVKEFNALTEEAVATAKTEAETQAKERDEKNRKATGLGGPSTTPSKGDDEGKSDADDLRDRKARLAKKRGLA